MRWRLSPGPVVSFWVSKHHTVEFSFRADTESVLSGPEVPQDASGEDVESVEKEVWSVACTEVVSEVEAEVAVLGCRPLQSAFLALDHLNVMEIFKNGRV